MMSIWIFLKAIFSSIGIIPKLYIYCSDAAWEMFIFLILLIKAIVSYDFLDNFFWRNKSL